MRQQHSSLDQKDTSHAVKAGYRSALGGAIIGCPERRSMERELDPLACADSVAEPQPPEGLSLALQALWWDAKGDWKKAHERAQERDDVAGMRVHAYLHRKEGDQSNAEYWYRRCGATPAISTLDEEWDELARKFLQEG
jgi:hypothetical protein